VAWPCTRHRDNFDFGVITTERPGCFQPFAIRHHDVSDDHVTSLLAIAFKAGFTIGRFLHFVPGGDERSADHLANHVAVINHQHSVHQ
jgi:hypothetical protein